MAKVFVRRFPWPFRLGKGSLHREAVEEVMPPSKTEAILDTRNDNRSPKWYMDNYPRQKITEFKFRSAIDIVYAGGSFCVLETYVAWGSMTGDGVAQRANNLYDRSSWYRVASSENTWGAWKVVH